MLGKSNFDPNLRLQEVVYLLGYGNVVSDGLYAVGYVSRTTMKMNETLPINQQGGEGGKNFAKMMYDLPFTFDAISKK